MKCKTIGPLERAIFRRIERVAAIFCMGLVGVAAGPAWAASDVTPTLSTLADRAMIEDLLVDYYQSFNGKKSDFASFYSDDGILDVNGLVAQGRKAIEDLYASLGNGPSKRPGVFRMLLTNVKISVNGATATADAIWTGINDENVKATPQFVEQGREHDELIKQDGHWYIAHRWITADAGLPPKFEKTYKPRDF